MIIIMLIYSNADFSNEKPITQTTLKYREVQKMFLIVNKNTVTTQKLLMIQK